MDIFPSTLIISINQLDIDNQISQICSVLNNNIDPNNPDILTIDQTTGWTIDLIRQTRHFLSQKPFNHSNKIIVIYQAENLNLESQNALLKTLEEPGLNNYVILSTAKPSKLLSTIISRCQTIKLKNTTKITDDKPLKILGDIQKDLLTSESLSKDKTQVLPFLENQLKLQKELLIKNQSKETSLLIQKLIKATQMINANVDPKSALDFLFLP
jgi:DNA polymerase III delta prime subunit